MCMVYKLLQGSPHLSALQSDWKMATNPSLCVQHTENNQPCGTKRLVRLTSISLVPFCLFFDHFAVLKGGDPFHSAAVNGKGLVWLARLNGGTQIKTLRTVTATYAMLHAQLSLNLHDQSNPSLLLLQRQHSTSQWPLIITMYSSQTDIMRDVSNPKQYNFNEVCLNF